MDADTLTMNKLRNLQRALHDSFGVKVDVYRQAGVGVLAVMHGAPLAPENVVYSIDDTALHMFH